jgi:hypothetical protein
MRRVWSENIAYSCFVESLSLEAGNSVGVYREGVGEPGGLSIGGDRVTVKVVTRIRTCEVRARLR